MSEPTELKPEWISKVQIDALELIDEVLNEKGHDRDFVQAELPGVKLMTMDALVNKGYLTCGVSAVTGVAYYERTQKQTPARR